MKRNNNKSKIDSDLLKILVCSACKGPLKLKKNSLKCIKCKKEYTIKEGIPFMLLKKE